MKINIVKNKSSNSFIEIPIEEYEYLKSLEDAVKHPERYNNDDPDYLTPEEIVLVYKIIKRIKKGDYSGYVNLNNYKRANSL